MSGLFGLVQARMGSTRLPGKVMKTLAGQPLIGHIFDRLEATEGVSGVVLATTVDPRNDPMVSYAESRGIPVFRAQGEDDIAERLAGAARLVDAEAILKINADCPMVDPAVLRQIILAWENAPDADYASNKIVWTWPEGMSAEIIGRQALEWCDANLITAEDREFTANWIRDHREQFSVVSVEGDRDLTSYAWCVDTPEDFEEVSALFAALYPQNPLFGVEALLRHLEGTT